MIVNPPIPSFSKSFNGPIIMIGFGTIGKALLPLIKRHIVQSNNSITIISPDDSAVEIANKYEAEFICKAISPENYFETLTALIKDNTEQAFIINLATEVSSKDLIEFSLKYNCYYIDTVVEPWPGFYLNQEISKADQSNYALREELKDLKAKSKNKTTAISCCGANPGMVSWFVKKALLDIANDSKLNVSKPTTQSEWSELMQKLNIKGIHIAEKDNQIGTETREVGTFTNTWSADGCIAECLQPAELGWGTHEKELPSDGHEHASGNKSSIYLDTPGGAVKVKTWTPTFGKHFGYLITHNEAISISDYFTIKDNNGEVTYRPTCHYAYHPSDVTVNSIDEIFENDIINQPEKNKILSEIEIVSGADELGVMLYGNEQGAYWFGSRLEIDEARELAPHQNATGMQVASAVLAGIFYSLNHPNEGLIETDEMDFEECLSIQKHYLGNLFGSYTNWTPDETTESSDINENTWQFSNIRITPPRLIK